MDQQDFTTTLVVEQTPQEVFDAINDVGGWWSGEIEGRTDKLNEEFTYRQQDFHYCKMTITELVPGARVAWLVTESSLTFVKDKGEWTGTTIRFDISRQSDKTRLAFTHEGLIPTLECYNDCNPGWTHYLRDGLLGLITTGKSHAGQEASEAPVR
jgi:regulatory protein YycH of two-component signal transduction system YycFG